VDSAHLAGMAEIATGVLHNIGNALNSVNLTAQQMMDNIRKSKTADLIQLSELLQKHKDNLVEFIAKDPKGIGLLTYYMTVGNVLTQERKLLQTDADLLVQGLSSVKEAVFLQQTYANQRAYQEKIQLVSLLKDVLRLQEASFIRHRIRVEEKVQETSEVIIHKNKLVHVFINILENARDAMAQTPDDQKVVRIEANDVDEDGKKYVKVKISDNGSGISPESLDKIFSYGFTTKKRGHGFGLHSAANAMGEMGGKLLVESAGIGKGAAFTLLIPVTKEG
jgi:signal transduction histidine kinase